MLGKKFGGLWNAILWIFIMTSTSCNSKKEQKKEAEAGEIPNVESALSTHELLAPGRYNALILDSMMASPRLDSINRKLDSALKSDPAFFENLQRFAKKGNALPYSERMGITREGYIEAQVLMTRIRLTGSKKQDIIIASKDGFYYLKGDKALSYLNGIAFDSVTNIFYVDTAQLFTAKPSIVKDSLNFFGSAWTGHTYKNQNYVILENGADIPTKGRFNAYKITVGKLQPSGKVFLLVAAKEFENSVMVVNLEQTIYLQPGQ